jgi:hypothetical protein
MLYSFLISPLRATCPTHVILLDLMFLITFGEVRTYLHPEILYLLRYAANSMLFESHTEPVKLKPQCDERFSEISSFESHVI